MCSVLDLPGFIDFDGNGRYNLFFLDKHSTNCDHIYSRVARLLPYAKSVANAILKVQKLCLEVAPYGFSMLFFDYQCEARKLFFFFFLCQ